MHIFPNKRGYFAFSLIFITHHAIGKTISLVSQKLSICIWSVYLISLIQNIIFFSLLLPKIPKTMNQGRRSLVASLPTLSTVFFLSPITSLLPQSFCSLIAIAILVNHLVSMLEQVWRIYRAMNLNWIQNASQPVNCYENPFQPKNRRFKHTNANIIDTTTTD